MHAQQALISLCVFVFLSHLHKLRCNTFIFGYGYIVVAVARFFSSHYSSSSTSSSSSSSWILSSYLWSSTHLFIQYLCCTVCHVSLVRTPGHSYVCVFILQFINSVGSNSSSSHRRSNSNRKCSNHPFIANPNSYRYNQTKIKASQSVPIFNILPCALLCAKIERVKYALDHESIQRHSFIQWEREKYEEQLPSKSRHYHKLNTIAAAAHRNKPLYRDECATTEEMRNSHSNKNDTDAKHNVLIIIIDNKLNCQHFSAKYRFRWIIVALSARHTDRNYVCVCLLLLIRMQIRYSNEPGWMSLSFE